MKVEKTGYNYRTRKERDIMAFIYDANGVLLDAINPGTGNHRTALDWATWRANTIREDYPAANTMLIHCGDDEIAVIALDNNTPDNTTPETPAAMSAENTPEKNGVTVTISRNGFNLYTATVNGVTVGSVNAWLNNTFAASYNFGINTRKRLAMPELNNAHDAAHGFMTEANALLSLGDMIARYFANYGMRASIVNA